jgi:hypothetical protein
MYKKMATKITNHPTKKNTDPIYIPVGDAFEKFDNFIVETTDYEVKDGIEYCKNEKPEKVKCTFISVGHNILKYSVDELIEHCKADTKEFTDWSTDVVLFYVIRHVLFDKPIPLLPEKPNNVYERK